MYEKSELPVVPEEVKASTYYTPFSYEVMGGTRAVLRPNIVTVLPRVFRVESWLPNWRGTAVEFLATPELGARFAEAEVQVQPGGGTRQPEGGEGLQHFLYVLEGELKLKVDGRHHALPGGGYAWLPPGVKYEVANDGEALSRAVWFRSRYQEAAGIPVPDEHVGHAADVEGLPEGTCYAQYLIPFEQDRGFDLAFNILSFGPSVCFDRSEAHIFEHGAYFLTGRGLFWIAGEYYPVAVDDFVYFAPYVPHFVCCHGDETLSYLLYKNVNRDVTDML